MAFVNTSSTRAFSSAVKEERYIVVSGLVSVGCEHLQPLFFIAHSTEWHVACGRGFYIDDLLPTIAGLADDHYHIQT